MTLASAAVSMESLSLMDSLKAQDETVMVGGGGGGGDDD